jgi:serine/threonine protein kinase
MASSERALGRYTLEEPIATGTTATIWRARDTRTGRQVAVKRFHQHLFADRVARKRMDNEAKAALKVRAPTIVSALDRISTRDEFALVFPFVGGTALSERLREQPPLSAEEAARIAADIADALAAIHSAGFVHRDVKPGNVLIGEDGVARLLDFGISHAVTDEIGMDQALTGAGLAIGTLPYMAPEQLAGETATAATDMFALGVVLYEMLAGERPFRATTPVAIATEQRTLPARIADAPGPLVDICMRALAVDPVARPTARDMSVALRLWQIAPIAADAPTAAVNTVRAIVSAPEQPSRRRFAGVATAALAAVGVLVIAVVALAAIAPVSAPSSPPVASLPDVVGAAPTSTPGATSTSTPAPAVPAAQPKPTPAATPPPTSPPASNPPPAPNPPAPKHHAHHHHRHHHHHHRHHHRHHH